jgi:hypothetical protein
MQEAPLKLRNSHRLLCFPPPTLLLLLLELSISLAGRSHGEAKGTLEATRMRTPLPSCDCPLRCFCPPASHAGGGGGRREQVGAGRDDALGYWEGRGGAGHGEGSGSR